MTLIILVTVFLATAGVLVGVYVFVNRRQLAATDSARSRLRGTVERQQAQASILRGTSVSSIPLLDTLLNGRSVTDSLISNLQRAGVATQPGTFILYAAMCVGAGALLGTMMGGGVMTVLCTVGGAALPLLWLRSKQKKRRNNFQEQLPEALDMLVSAMRAGYSFQAAMKFIGDEVKAPLGPEFGRFYEEQRLGMDVRTALLSLQDRVDSLDLKMFVTAVLIQRETGGNLAEVLSNISGLMRERSAIKGEIETLTAESKLSARVLSALPILVFGVVKLMNPDFLRPMLASEGGRIALMIALAMVISGYFSMMKIADIDI